MNYFLPTYDQCVRICNEPDSTFYENTFVVDGYDVSLFNYRIGQFSAFDSPIVGDETIKAFELRGLAFVFNKDGSLYKRFLLLQKFFNLNQTESYLYDVVKNYTIKDIHNKEDGSIISFIELPNGSVVAKSKMSFTSDQAYGANRLYDRRKDIKEFVDYTIKNNLVAVFEYVAPHNRIVLNYKEEDLILLRVRDNSTGEYVDLKDLDKDIGDIKVADLEDLRSLDTLVEESKVLENKEGWVVHSFDENGNDFFFKLKTDWYFHLHGLLTNNLYREHMLVQYILDDEIDDVIAQIPIDEVESIRRIDKIISVVNHEMNVKASEIRDLYETFMEMGEDKREFGMKYSRNRNFGYVMAMVNSFEPLSEYDMAKRHILNTYNKLEVCREWLMDKDPSIFDYIEPPTEDELV